MKRLCAGLLLVALLAGCAARPPRIFAWRDPGHRPTTANPIALTTRLQPQPLDRALDAALLAELAARGFTLTNAAHAEYLLASWIEDYWTAVRPAPVFGAGDFAGAAGIITFDGSPVTEPGSLSIGVSADGRWERYLASQGIRLELYPQPKGGRPDFSPAWSASIEGGKRVRADEIPALLHRLLDYYGQKFTGRAKPGP